MATEDLVRELQARGGIARTSELRAAGFGKRTLAAAVARGDVARARTGLLVLPTLDADAREALSHGGLLACASACRSHGLWVLDAHDDRVHTWIAADRHPGRLPIDPETGDVSCCVFHRDTPRGAPDDRRVAVVHALAQLLRCRGPEAFFAALESALRQSKLPSSDRALLRSIVRAEDRWLVDLARADADSGLESLLRLRLHRLGITLAAQVEIPGVGRVDFVLGDCLILEADGKTHDGETRHRDRMRDALAMALGFITLRFDYAMIVHDWPLVEAAVVAAVGRRLHRSDLGLRREGEASTRSSAVVPGRPSSGGGAP